MDSSHPPVQKLVVPAAAPMSGNRSVSFRPTLTPGGLGRTLDRTPRDTPTRQSPQLSEITPGPSLSTIGLSGPDYPLSSTPAASSVNSGGGKMKRERTAARPSSKRPADEEVAEVPDLPSISLPISTSALPTFSFSTPLPSVTTSTSVNSAPNATPAKEPITNKEPAAVSSPPPVPFTFSSPIVKATAASPPSFSPSAGFTFSAPVAKIGPSMSNGKPGIPITAAVKPGSSKSTEEFEGPFKPAKTLKQGSVLDLLKAPGFASPVTQTSSGPEVTSQQTSTQSTATSSTSSTSSSLSSSAGFSDSFKPPAGWSCDVCLVQNKASDSKCVCCMSPQPNSASTKSADSKASPPPSTGLDSSSTTTTSSVTTTTTFGGIFSKPTGTWDCDTCLVQNKPDAVKCVACETAKPGTGLKSSLTLPSAFSAVKTVSTATAPVSTGIIGFGDKFKKPEGSWECDTCMVQNKAEDTKCVACTSPKPGASEGASAAAVAATVPPLSASSASVFGAGDKFKKPEGSWDCDVCLLQNKAADVQCVACQAAKPGAKVEAKAFGSSDVGNSGSSTFGSSTSGPGSFRFGTSDSTSGSGAGGFKFGGSFSESSSSSSGGFKFGTSFGSSSSETTSKDTTASSGFKFGSSSEGFKFGAASSDDKKSDQPATGSGFKFGASGGIVFGTGSSSTESNLSKGGFTFGLSAPEEKTADSTTTSSTSSFTPLVSQEESDSTAASNDTTSANTDTSTTTTTTSSSVFGRLGEPSLAITTTQGSSTFGSISAEKEPAAPTFSFGKPEEKREELASSAPSTFLFGAASKDTAATPVPAPSGGFSFSKPSTTTDPPPPAFTFGKPADKSETATTDAPKPTFTFGQSATDSVAAPKPAFSFMANNPSTTNSTSTTSSTPTPSLFGNSSNNGSSASQAPAPSAAPSTFLFGQPPASSNDAPSAKAFVFGQSQDSQSAVPSAAAAQNSTPAPASAQPFIFGAPANAAAAAPAPAAPSFNFGAAAPPAASSSAPSSTPSPFVFSSGSSGGFGASQTPSFGSTFGSPFTAAPSQPPAFGAKPNAAPVFGQQTNSTPVFGAAANSAPSGGFQFGGASAFGTSNNTSGVFTFGSGTAASPAPSATPSIAPQSGPPVGGFSFTQPPTFNIGLNKAFPASPAGQQAIAGRRIKTAVRRRK